MSFFTWPWGGFATRQRTTGFPTRYAAAFVSLFLCSFVSSPAQAQFTALTRQAQLWRQYNEPAEFVVLRSKDRFICEPGVPWTRTRPLVIHGDVNDPPLAGLVLCRNSKGDSVHGSSLSNIRFTGAFKIAPLIILCHEGIAIDNVIVDCSVKDKPAAGVAGIIFSSVDLWNLGVPAGFTCTGATITNTHAYNWQGGDAVDVLFVGEVTDIDWRGLQSSGKGLARIRAHSVPRYRWSNGLGESAGVPKRINVSHAGMAEGTFAHNFVRTRDAAQPQFAQDITFAGVNWQPHDIPPVVAPPGGGNTGGGPSGGGTDEPDGPPPPPSTSLSSFVPAPEFPARDVSTAARQDWTGRTPSIGYFPIALSGTAAAPVVMNFANADGSRQRVPHKFYVTGSYAVISGLDAHKIEIGPGSHHIVLQNCRAGGDATRKGAGFAIAGSGAAPVSQIVLSACEASSNGDWLAEFDEDFHGLAIGGHVAHVWVTGSLFYHNSGDAIQINAGSLASQDGLHHIYVVGNEMRECKQTGGAVKQARNVVFAANHVHHMKPIGRSPSAWGAGVGHQYGAGPVWFIANHIHDCSFGIQSGSTSGLGDGQDAYYLFNVIHDIRHEPAYAYNPNTAWSNAGFSLVGNPNKYVIGNTIINADGGIYFVGGVRLLAEGNIIAGNSNQDVWLEDPNGATLEVYSNLAWPSAELRIANQAQAWPIGNLVGDPKFLVSASSRFVPGPGSPAIAAWTPSISARSVFQRYRDTFGVSIEVDATGRARPQGAWTIGALQP